MSKRDKQIVMELIINKLNMQLPEPKTLKIEWIRGRGENIF
jgi:hypothetical protein